ncbi:MAG: PQQ-binding-like beta-propeller repeat protein, partial [Planctomycetes bacterium]|nr:PQQ-binding-like beta-propeller repeat protein [Planctomycetota bacterium]
ALGAEAPPISALQEHLGEVLREALSTNRTLPEIIAARGWGLEPAAFEAMLVAQAREEILSALGECQAYFRFREGDVPEELLGTMTGRPPTCVPRQALALALEGRRRDQEEVTRSIPILDEVFVVSIPTASTPGRTFYAAYIEASTLKLVDGRRTVREILSVSPFFESVVLQVLVGLLARGAIKKTRLLEIAGIQLQKLTPAKAQEVLPLYRRVVRHAHNELEIRLALAHILHVAGQRDKAIEEYCAIGDATARHGRYDEALPVFEKARELSPNAQGVIARIRSACVASAHEAVARKDKPAAELSLRRAIEVCPEDLDLYVRLLAVLAPSRDVKKLTEIADAASARSRASGDPRLGVTVLETIARAMPDDPTWRIRRANLLLDLDRKDEAIQEMFTVATALREKGDAERGAVVLAKLERLAGDREDVLRAIRDFRRALPQTPKPKRKKHRIRLAVVALALIVIAYQGVSYIAYTRVERQVDVAEAAEAPATARQAHEVFVRAHETSARYRDFRSRWPASVWAIAAGGRIAAATERARKASELRDEIREASFRRADKLRELGDHEGARIAFSNLLREGFDDPWHAEALAALDKILSGEAQAEELALRAKEAETAGRFEDAFRAARQALDKFPASRSAASLSLPIEVTTDPAGARVWVGGTETGPAPCVIHIPHFQPVEVTAVLPGFEPSRMTIENPREFRVTIALDRAPTWRIDLSASERAPIAAGDSIFAVDGTGGIHAITSALGRSRWAYREGAVTEVRAGPVRIRDTLCFATNDGRITLIDEARGTRRASIQVGGLVSSELVPILGGQGAAVATRDGNIRAFDLTRGASIWRASFTPISPRAIARAGGWVVVATAPTEIVFLSEETGQLSWRHDLGARPIAGPIVADGLVLCASDDGRIHAIDTTKRKAAWSVEAGAAAGPFLSVGDGLWFTDSEERLRAVSIRDGSARGRLAPSTNRPRWVAPGPNGSLLVDAGPGRIAALDPATGRTRWRFSGDGTFGAPPVCQGDLVVAASDLALYGIRAPRDADPAAPDPERSMPEPRG